MSGDHVGVCGAAAMEIILIPALLLWHLEVRGFQVTLGSRGGC